MDTNQEPPKTVKEVGIHLLYLSKDVSDIKKQLTEMSGHYATKKELVDAIGDRKEDQKTLERFIETKADASEVSTLKCTVDEHTKIINGVRNQIAVWATIILVGMVLAQYGLQEFFKG